MPTGPELGVSVSVATLVVNWVETMKFAASRPWETATQLLPLAQVTVTPDGIAPAALDVNWIAAGQPTAPEFGAQQRL